MVELLLIIFTQSIVPVETNMLPGYQSRCEIYYTLRL